MNNFDWTEECQQTFEDSKKFLASLSLLSKPKLGEELYIYLAAIQEEVNYMLIWLDDKEIQKPIYYTSRTLHGTETRYAKPKKIIFILITSAHLRPHFQAHPIVVLTNQLLHAILQHPNTSRRMAK